MWHADVIAKQIPFPVIPSAFGETEEQIEAAPVRQAVVRIRAVVPLADALRSIAHRMQRLGDRQLGGAHRLAIVGDPMAARAQRPTPR